MPIEQTYLGASSGSVGWRALCSTSSKRSRSHIPEEYTLTGSCMWFLDTMVLHVTVKSISSHWHPAWMKHCRSKVKEHELAKKAKEAIVMLLHETELCQAIEQDAMKREELHAMHSVIRVKMLTRR